MNLTRRELLAAGATALVATACRRTGIDRLAATPGLASSDGFDREVAAIVRRIVPPSFPARVVSIATLGATGDGSTDALPAIRRAISETANAGGGRVLVPAGRWQVNGPIHLKSNVELHVAEGATLRFSTEPGDYLPLVVTRWEATELYNYSPLIYAYQATNVAVTGKGTIDGNGKAGFATWKPKEGPDLNRLRQMGIDGVPVHERIFGEGHFLRPSFIQFWGCQNVLVEDLTIVDSPFWIVHPVYCRNVTARRLRISSHNPNNDGVDPESSADVLIERCTFDTGDDCVAIKSGRDQDGWRVGRPSENIVVRDCDMDSLKASICLGSEMSGGLRNIYVDDVRVGRTFTGVYFKTNLDRGGYVNHVRIRNVPMREAEIFIHFTTDYQGYRGGKYPPDVRDVVIERVRCERASRGIRAVGVPDAPLRDILLRDVTLGSTPAPHEIRNVRDFRLENVRINGERLALPATIA